MTYFTNIDKCNVWQIHNCIYSRHNFVLYQLFLHTCRLLYIILRYIASFKSHHQQTITCFESTGLLLPEYTLKEHHQFRTKMTISVISDWLKSMVDFFQGFYPWKICNFTDISASTWKLLHSLKGLCGGVFYQILFKVNCAGNGKKLKLCLTKFFFGQDINHKFPTTEHNVV